MKKMLVLMFSVLVLCACSSRPQVDAAAVNRTLRQDMAAEADSGRIRIPLQLAVHFKPLRDAESQLPAQWQWTHEDRTQITRTLQRLIRVKVLSGYAVLDASVGQTQAELQRAVKDAGAQAVLVLHGAGDVEEGHNRAAKFYALGLTTLFVPGNEMEGVFMVGATLWSADHARAHMAVVAQADKRAAAPLWFADPDAVLTEARERAMRKLRAEIYQGFLDLAFGVDVGRSAEPQPSGANP